jgi:hypothetical protein
MKSPSRRQCIEIRCLSAINICATFLGIFALIATQVKSDHFNINNIDADSKEIQIYSRGSFDLETWVCSLQHALPASYSRAVYATYAKQCVIERAGTGVVVVFAVFAISASIWTMMVNRTSQEEGSKHGEPKSTEDWESERTVAV